jgi:hypothetical protein
VHDWHLTRRFNWLVQDEGPNHQKIYYITAHHEPLSRSDNWALSLSCVAFAFFSELISQEIRTLMSREVEIFQCLIRSCLSDSGAMCCPQFSKLTKYLDLCNTHVTDGV